MCGNALAAVEDLDRARRDPRPHLLAQQLVWHRVVVLLDLDVIVEPDPAFLPFGEDVRFGRQRLESRPLQILEQHVAARAKMPRHTIVDLCDQLGDGRVQCGEREELAVTQLGDDRSESQSAPQLRPWPCHGPDTAAPEQWRCRNGPPSRHRFD